MIITIEQIKEEYEATYNVIGTTLNNAMHYLKEDAQRIIEKRHAEAEQNLHRMLASLSTKELVELVKELEKGGA